MSKALQSQATGRFWKSPAKLPLLLGLALALWLFAAALCSAQEGAALGAAWAEPGGTAVVPILAIDTSNTALGRDAGPGRRIQGMAFAVGLSMPAWVSSVSFEAAGITDGLTPLFETTTVNSGGDRHAWIIAFDEAAQPIPFTLDEAELVGRLRVDIAPSAPIGSLLELDLDGNLTALANQGGSLVATEALAGGLVLMNGSVLVESPPLFVDGFESGDVSAWASSIP